MCDTLIATKLAGLNGVAVFGKNSDRPPNEGQSMVFFAAADHAPGSRVKCTYIEVPQAAHTHAVLLSKPYWMWGAEIGVNEHGLVIGNEAVYSKVAANKEPALLGMDMLRIALERAATPTEAIQILTDLLAQFGQGGNCGAEGNDMYYHNSFIVANADDAWVLETVDKQWAAKQVRDVYTISNCLTIGNQYDLSSDNLVGFAEQKGVSRSGSDFHLARDFSDFLYTTFSKGARRRETTFGSMDEQKGKVSIESMMATLRHHKHADFDPRTSISEQDVCMHAGFGPIRISQSTASLVAYLDKSNPVIFATGTAAPCTSVFKPFWMDSASFLSGEPVPTHRADSASLFWSHERLHRAVLENYAARLAAYSSDRDVLEARFIAGAMGLRNASGRERSEFSRSCYEEARSAESDWLRAVESVPVKRSFLHAMAWNGFNQKAGLGGQ